ncbi:MAG: aldose 1-epimerase family protein [Candidatus Dormibacteria bacterium]
MASDHATKSVLPSGKQFHLRRGAQEAVVTEIGATLRDYKVDGRPIVDGFPSDQRSRDGRGQLLIPWPNRIEDGRYEFGGSIHQLPLNEVDRRNAIHGLTRWSPWSVAAASADSVVLEVAVAEQPGYEFSLRANVEYRLCAGGLTVTVRALNCGHSPLPVGVGAHPYLTAGTEAVDEVFLSVPAGFRLEVDDRGIPRGEPVPVGGSTFDFRQRRAIGKLALDTTFTGLIRDTDGVARVHLTAPDESLSLELWADQAHEYLQLFTGDTLTEPRVRRRSLAVEPMTCAPNAFASGRGLITLAPRETLTARWGLGVA